MLQGITLSCLGKLSTTILNARLAKYYDEINLIGESQAGFRKGNFTIDHIFVLKCVIDLFIWKKKLFCLFVDYSKAFHMVYIRHDDCGINLSETGYRESF